MSRRPVAMTTPRSGATPDATAPPDLTGRIAAPGVPGVVADEKARTPGT
jgi:hypothetical protein